MLEDLGYTVLSINNPLSALRMVETYSGHIDLLITDVVLPEMTGRDLVKNLSAIKPGLKCIYMSGYTANAIAHQGVLEEGINFLQKPFSREQLAIKIRDVLDS
jgi:DNA-binding NtrC family response regulator